MSGDRREIMEAMGDKTRYGMLQALMKKSMTGDELAEAVQRSRSTVESHLAMLLRLELISRRLEDRTYYYEATPLAKGWMEQMHGSPAPETLEALRPAPHAPVKKPAIYRLAWIWLPIVFGILFFATDAAKLPLDMLVVVIFGLVASFLIDNIRQMFMSIFIASVTIGLLVYAIIFPSDSSSFFFTFFVALVFMGLAMIIWFIIRIFRRFFKK